MMKLRKMVLPLVLGALLLLSAVAAVQAYSGYYYVVPTALPMKECAAPECSTLLTAYQGERVEILERNNSGWSRVRLVDRSGIGWVPSDMLTYSPGTPSTPMPPYFVKVSSVALRDAPSPEARTVTTMYFNDRVEMLGVGASGWAQVRDLRTSIVGYVDPRYLSTSPSRSPKSSRRRHAPKAAPKEEPQAPPKAM
jgi:hypothetical protein